MASELRLPYEQLIVEVSDFCGEGRNVGALPADSLARFQSFIKSGLTRFYGAYGWHFMVASGTIAHVAETEAYALPADFANFTRPLVYNAGAGDLVPVEIKQVNETVFNQLSKRHTTPFYGRPYACAVFVVSPFVPATGTRYEVKFFPIPDQVATVAYEYQRAPDTMDANTELPMGIAFHREAIIESCLAVAEQRLGDSLGIHTQLYQNLLQQSIEIERRQHPPSLGISQDPSMRGGYRLQHEHNIQIDGVPLT